MHFSTQILRLFLCPERRAMLIRYKKNGKTACYDSDTLTSGIKLKNDPHPRGPFPSCGECPYPSDGFICYSSEGDCMRTYMQKISKRRIPKNE